MVRHERAGEEASRGTVSKAEDTLTIVGNGSITHSRHASDRLPDGKLTLPIIAKAWRYYREHGFRDFVYRIQRRLEYVVYVKRPQLRDAGAECAGVRFRVATEADAPLLAGIVPHWGVDREQLIRRKLAAGEMAIVGIHTAGGRGAYLSWLAASDPLMDTVLSLEPPKGDVCSRQIFVPEELRGRGVARAGLRFAEQVAAEQAWQRVWAFVFPDNASSLKLHDRLRYRCYGLLRVGRRLGRRYAQLKPAGESAWRPVVYPE